MNSIKELSDLGQNKEKLTNLSNKFGVFLDGYNYEDGVIKGEVTLEGFLFTDADGVIHIVDNLNK